MDTKLWSFWDKARGHFHSEKYLIVLSYYYLELLTQKEPKSEILKTDIKGNLMRELSREELDSIDTFLKEDFKLEDIKQLLIDFFTMIDYSPQMMHSSSNESILNLAGSFLDTTKSEFADFCSGNGAMLSKALKNKAENIKGIEINGVSRQLSILRLWLEQGTLLTDEIIHADVFEYFEKNPEEKFHQIFSEFPLGLRRKEKYVFEDIEINQNSDWGFISLVMNQLKEDGRAVVISTVGIETRKSDEKIKEHFIREGYIEEIIALPAGILTGTGIPSFMLILSYGNESIRFTDASEIYSKAGRVRLFEEKDIEKIINSDNLKVDVPIEKVLEEGRLSPEFYLLPEIKGGIKLGEIADILNSRSVRKKEIDEYSAAENTGVQLIRLSHVKKGQILDGDFISKAMPKLVELKDLDLIVTRTGSTLNVALYQEEDMHSFVDENFFVIRLNNNDWNPYYLFAYLQSEMGQKYLSSAYSGATIQRVNKKDLLQLDIPVMELTLQNKIAEKTQEYLEKINQLQFSLEVIKDEKDEVISSWFKEG